MLLILKVIIIEVILKPRIETLRTMVTRKPFSLYFVMLPSLPFTHYTLHSSHLQNFNQTVEGMHKSTRWAVIMSVVIFGFMEFLPTVQAPSRIIEFHHRLISLILSKRSRVSAILFNCPSFRSSIMAMSSMFYPSKSYYIKCKTYNNPIKSIRYLILSLN